MTKSLETIREELPFWQSLHTRLREGDNAVADAPEVQDVFFPHPRYRTQPVQDTLREIAHERGTLCFDLIGRQFELADTGAERVKFLRRNFNHYAHIILDGHVDAANADLYQQELDVSIMYVLSHSQLQFAFKYAADRPDHLASCKMAVDAQARARAELQKGYRVSYKDLATPEKPVVSDKEISDFRLSYDIATRDVADCNENLCAATLDLFQNQCRALYHWMRSMEQVQASCTFPGGFNRTDDYQYESELQEIYLQRCGILATRGLKIRELSDRVASLD